MRYQLGGSFESLYTPYKTLLTSDEESNLFDDYKNHHNRKAAEELILSHSPIVNKVEKQLRGYGVDPEELVSEGLLALVTAVDNFNPQTGNRFAAYAYTYARGSMLTYISKNYFDVTACSNKMNRKVFFSLRKKLNQMLKDAETTTVTNKMISQLAKDFKISEKIVGDMYGLMTVSTVYLDEFVRNDDSGNENSSKYDIVRSMMTNILSPEDLYAIMENTELQQKIIDTAMTNVLDHRERTIFVAQKLSEKEDIKTLETLGNEFDISKERVRQLRNKALIKITAEIHRIVRDGGIDIDTILD